MPQRLGFGKTMEKRVRLDVEWDGAVDVEVHRIIWDAASTRDSTNASNLGFYSNLAMMTSDCCLTSKATTGLHPEPQ